MQIKLRIWNPKFTFFWNENSGKMRDSSCRVRLSRSAAAAATATAAAAAAAAAGRELQKFAAVQRVVCGVKDANLYTCLTTLRSCVQSVPLIHTPLCQLL